MGVVKRTGDGIDMLEHAMQGVHSSENRGRIVRFHAPGGIIGLSSSSEVRVLDDTPVEREVIVRLPDRRRTR
jgi:hypothetical protein